LPALIQGFLALFRPVKCPLLFHFLGSYSPMTPVTGDHPLHPDFPFLADQSLSFVVEIYRVFPHYFLRALPPFPPTDNLSMTFPSGPSPFIVAYGLPLSSFSSPSFFLSQKGEGTTFLSVFSQFCMFAPPFSLFTPFTHLRTGTVASTPLSLPSRLNKP